MAARADFVSDYQVGQQVTVVLGNGALCWSGQLVEIGERRIRLKMDDDTVRSVSYEGIIADYLSPQVVPAQGAQAPAQENPFTAIEIAQTLQDMMNLKMEEVESINATPVEEKILVKVQLTDGSSEMYLMTKDSDTGSITLLAFNN